MEHLAMINKDKPVKRKRSLRIAIVLLFLTIAAYVGWEVMFVTRSVVQARSPDGKYQAVVSSEFGLSSNSFNIKVKDNNDHLIRHLVVHDKLPGWSTDPAINWSSNSKAVTIDIQDPDAGLTIKQITIQMP